MSDYSCSHIADPRTHFQQAAHSTALALAPADLYILARTLEICQQRQQQGYGQCTLSVGHRVLPDDQQVILHTGLGLTIRVPAPMSAADLESNLFHRIARHRARRAGDIFDPGEPDDRPEESHPPREDDDAPPEDAISFMARRGVVPALSSSSSSTRSSSTSSIDDSSSHSSDPPTWLSTVIFSTDGRSVTIDLPWGFQDPMITAAAHAFMLYENEIIRVHRVSSQPHDLIQLSLQCAILQRSDAVRPYDSFRLILFDVEVYDESEIQPVQLRRFPRWSPSRMTPRSIMRLLGLDQQCLNPRLFCTLWHNNVLWPLQDSMFLTLEDGDYVKVLVRNLHLVCSTSSLDVQSDVSSLAQFSSAFAGHRLPQCTERLTDVLVAHDHRPGHQYSFTDAFLQAVRLFQEAATDLPEFSDDEDNPDHMAPWIRELYSIWNRLATIGPGHVERLARLETWFSDHVNLQQSHVTRMAILGSDVSRWERQLKLLWRDHLVPEAPLEFHLVDPLPEDAASNTMGQLILVQRPDRFQRSIIISVYDNWYDRGMSHSQAYVTVDRVDMHSVRWVLEAENDCPPEQAHHVCALWFGNRQMADHERMVARPIAYIQTWHLNGLRATRCQSPRTVRLRFDVTAWQRSVTDAWADRLDLRLPVLFIWVTPTPINMVTQSFIGHLLVLQEMLDEQAAILLTALESQVVHPDVHHVAICSPIRLSATLAIDLFPIPTSLTRAPILVRIDQRLLHAQRTSAVEHGDNVVLEVTVPTHLSPRAPPVGLSASSSSPPDDALNSVDHTNLLQQHVLMHSAASAPHQSPAGPDILTVRLDDHFPRPVWTFVDCSKLDFLRRQMLQLPVQPCFDFDWAFCSASTMQVLSHTPMWTFEEPSALHFFTDGSFRSSLADAAAGIVLIVRTADGDRFGGLLSAHCLGLPSAPRAEVSAIFVALHWALHLAVHFSYGWIPFHFHFDNIYAGQAAQGRCQSVTNDDLTLATRSLVLWLQHFLWSPVEWHHVKGHADHPWNDFADSVAGHALQTHSFLFDAECLFRTCTFDVGDLTTQQWLWLFEQSLQGRGDAPVLHGLSWRFNAAAPLRSDPCVAVQPLHQRQMRQCCLISADANLTLRCATANVLTMYPGQDFASAFFGARAEHLAQQFQHAHLQCIGIQETRCRKQGHDIFAGFHVFSSSASARGHCGLQLWFVRSLQVGDHTLRFEHEHFRILHCDERRLLVKLHHPGLRLLLLVLHAPCDDDEAQVRAWWAQTTALIPSSLASWTWILLCDSNGRVGSAPSSTVGDHGAETENVRGALFHEWLLSHGLRLPQTFEESHSGPHFTWTHPSQGGGRIDFIGVSDNVSLGSIRTWVHSDVDLSTVRQDHACVCADIGLTLSLSTRSRPAPKPAVPVGFPSWTSDVHTHAALLQRHFASQVLPSPREHLRKKHLSDGTLNSVDSTEEAGSSEECYRVLSLRVCQAVREDDASFYALLAEQTGHLADHGYHRIWDAIKPLLPKWKKRKLSNIRCMGPTPTEQISHYCNLEAGQLYRYDDLLQHCHEAQQNQIDDLPLCLTLSQLPSLIDIEDRFQHLSIRRAPGIDGLTPDFLRDHGVACAMPLFHLAVKMLITGHEPLQFKGGLLHSISKKVMSRDVANMRGIMLIDVLGKILQSLLRQRFLPALMRWRHPLQLGGFPHCSTLFATHYLRTVQERANALSLSSAVLFIDVKSAFHSLVRQIIFGGEHPLPDHLCQLLADAGCDVQQLQQDLFGHSEAFRRDVPLCEQRLMQDAHNFTWFTIAGSDDTFCTARGSRPGSPLADVAFNALMVQVLTALHDALHDFPLLRAGFLALGQEAPPITWVDDVAVPIIAVHAAELESLIVSVANATIRTFLRFGLVLNLNKKKTEVVLAFRSTGAPGLRQDLFIDRLGRIPLSAGSHLQCVAAYEHLGTIFTADADLRGELTHRIARARQAHRQVAKTILRNRHVAIAIRLKLFESLVIPVLLHGSGNWRLLSVRQFQLLHALIVKWQRSIIGDGFWAPDQSTDIELQCQWCLPPLALRLAKARLLYAFHCMKDGPGVLIDFVTSVAHLPQSWFVALRKALSLLASMDGSFCPSDLHQASVERILQWLHDHLRHGPQRVRSLYKRSLLQFQVLGDAYALHKQLQHVLEDGGVSFQSVAPSLTSTVFELFPCNWCSHVFDSLQKLQVHRWVAHQLISEERRFVFSDKCQACRRCFWSAARLQHHLRQSRALRNGCYEQLTWRLAPLTDACAINVPEDLRGYSRLPSIVVSTAAVTPVEQLIQSREDACRLLSEHWRHEGLPASLEDDRVQLIFAIADRACSQCLDAYDFVGHFQRLKQAILDLLAQTPLGQLLDWQLRMDEAHRPVPDEPGELAGVVRAEQEPLIDPFVFQKVGFDPFRVSFLGLPDCSKVPVSFHNGQPIIWILHLFSGRRRRGDCHFWVECCKTLIPGHEVRILSVDTAIDPRFGNLDRGPVYDMLLGIIRKRWFAAGLTGPPCETFSAARHVQIPGRRHPRPLRSADCPWLLQFRSGRELRQTMVGTRLLFHSWIAEVEPVLAGGGSLMEHPRESADEQKVSVWRTEVHRRWLMALPDAFEHHIEQWQFGGRNSEAAG
eukprot:s3265_g11.t1